MADFQKGFCPKCGKDLGRYRIDSELHTSHKICSHCGTTLIVSYGKGKLKVIKQK